VTERFDFAVAGGGIVGLAVAAELLRRRPGAAVVVLERERSWGAGQTGRNSGVVHSGLYYAPGSLKARLCVAGARSMVEFCAAHGVPCAVTGKVVVATTASQLPMLDVLRARGEANGVPVRRLSVDEVRDVEPHVLCLGGLLVESTGVTDFAAVARALASDVASDGGVLRLGAEVTGRRGRVVETTSGEVEADLVIGCAGMGSDRLAQMFGVDPGVRIVGFRGEYFSVQREDLVRTLVYPVPDPAFPFLGVHLTRGVDGHVHAGPNAVLDRPLHSLRFSGTRVLARRHWRTGAPEAWRSLSRRAFLRALQQLVPEIADRDLVPAPAGVRAQAVRPDGTLVDDFLIVRGEGSIHVVNAPSPAATAALEIARAIADAVGRPPSS
jgi:L-2-hydroxyglutarate oxidase